MTSREGGQRPLVIIDRTSTLTIRENRMHQRGFKVWRCAKDEDIQRFILRWAMLRLLDAKDAAPSAEPAPVRLGPASQVVITLEVVMATGYLTPAGPDDAAGYLAMLRWAMLNVIKLSRSSIFLTDAEGDD